MTTSTFTAMSRSRAIEVMDRLSGEFGGADTERDVVGYTVRVAFWDPNAAREPRRYRYCGTEVCVGSSAEAEELIERLHGGEILTISEAHALRGRLGL